MRCGAAATDERSNKDRAGVPQDWTASPSLHKDSYALMAEPLR